MSSKNWSCKPFITTLECLCIHSVVACTSKSSAHPPFATRCPQRPEKAWHCHGMIRTTRFQRNTVRATASLSSGKTAVCMFSKHFAGHQSFLSIVVHVFAHPRCFKQWLNKQCLAENDMESGLTDTCCLPDKITY